MSSQRIKTKSREKTFENNGKTKKEEGEKKKQIRTRQSLSSEEKN